MPVRPGNRPAYAPTGLRPDTTGCAGRWPARLSLGVDASFVAQMSWAPDSAPDDSPWMRMFRNARTWVG